MLRKRVGANRRLGNPAAVSNAELARVIESLREDHGETPILQKAVRLARYLQTRGVELQSREEKRQQAEFERMVQSPQDKATLAQLTDQAFRSTAPSRAADQLTHILDVQGIPRFFSAVDRAMLKGFQSFGGYLPGVSIPLVKDRMRAETANVILPAEQELLSHHLQERRNHDLRMNVNYLGEALLGEEDAQRRLKSYLAALQLPAIEVISVKVSTIYSQITPISRRHAENVLCDRLELLYRAAAKARFTRHDGTVVPKFVYLDMEEYRDLSLTVDAFIHTLDRPPLHGVGAGIALQAYLPDSWAAQRRINEWARARVASGGAPVTIRVVKGANMETERVEASVCGWPQAPYKTKAETDANFKRMLKEGMVPPNIDAVRLGIASHNLFDISYALLLAAEAKLGDQIQFEMLEGMANHQRRALCELAGNMLLYAPATKKEDFLNAIGYLIRRLDENTGPDNFLRHAFKLEVDSDEWRQLEQDFISSFDLIDDLSYAPRRTQDRRQPIPEVAPPQRVADFVNEADTDFSLDANLEWASSILEDWRDRSTEIPLVIAGESILDDRSVRDCRDPSRPEVVVARYRQATSDDIDRALNCAKSDPAGWRAMADDQRGQILGRVAQELRRCRGALMGAALADGGKVLTESDPEVSEAIDFVEFYGASARELLALETVEAKGKGVVLVVPPWNFPIAIPCGGIAAGLAAGNTVLLKPASDTVLVAWTLCECFWRAGVPKQALQFVPCSGATGGARLAASPDVDAVILTGGTDTALRMLQARPQTNLLAETGGKNATIVSSMSDREQAIKHVLHSAFSHCGQKCSATSLLILEAEVYDDPRFKATLCDAVQSIRVGSAWQLDTKMGPMIRPPSGDLENGLKELEAGESWAVMPRHVEGNPNLYTPGVKWGVEPGSYTHMTEFFGPVLAVMRADDLHHAIEMVNQTGYGLTSGIETLDRREQAIWRDSIRAGNLYINRVTTGAVVIRQPFGGMGKSAFGPGIKAGGPSYAAQLIDFVDKPATGDLPSDAVASDDVEHLRLGLQPIAAGDVTQPGLPKDDAARVLRAIASYATSYEAEFGRVHDAVKLVGQDNLRRYLPVRALRIRVHAEDTPFEVFARVCAAKTAGCHITVSSPPDLGSQTVELLDQLTEPWAAAIEFVEESDEALAQTIRDGQTDRVRYAAAERVPADVLMSVGDTGVYVARAPVLVEGRIELLWYVMEQSISHDYHRYGNLGDRGDEVRRPVL